MQFAALAPEHSRPIPPVECAVVDCFAQMFDADFLCAGQVGDRAADAEDLVVGPGGEAEFFHRRFEQRFGVAGQAAVLADFRRRHLAVGFGGLAVEAVNLSVAGGDDLLAHLGARRAAAGVGQLAKGHRRHFDVDIDPIEQRSADAAEVSLDLHRLPKRCNLGLGLTL